MFITSELMGNVWVGDDLVTLLDGSDHLVDNPKTKQILKWNEREGTRSCRDQKVRGSSRSIRNGRFSFHLSARMARSIVFAKSPTEKVAYETAIAELTKAVQRTGGGQNLDGVRPCRSTGNRTGRRQGERLDGHYISVEFTAKTRKVTNGDGETLPVQITGVK